MQADRRENSDHRSDHPDYRKRPDMVTDPVGGPPEDSDQSAARAAILLIWMDLRATGMAEHRNTSC
jgi:hypothetical protein